MTHDHSHHAHSHEAEAAETKPKTKFALSEEHALLLRNSMQGMFSVKGMRWFFLVLLVLICGGFLISVVFFPPQSRILTQPKARADPRWLTTPLGDLPASYEQLMLFLDNQDPTLGDPGLIEVMLNQEAHRLKALAYQYVNSPGSPCYKQDVSVCFRAFEANAIKLWTDNPSPDRRLAVAVELKAMYMAQYKQDLLPMTPPNDSILPLIVSKFSRDRGLAYGRTTNSLAEEQLKLQREMQQGTAP